MKRKHRKTRDYRAEYKARIAKAATEGRSRSQGRGHPKASERPARTAPRVEADDKINVAIRLMHGGASLTKAAQAVHTSPERLRAFVKDNAIAKRDGRRWTMTDDRPRRVSIIADASAKAIIVPNFTEASRTGKYHNAVRRYVNSGNPDHLREFRGKGVHDFRGNFHPFETDPNDLFRYAAKDEPEFHELYQVIAA